MKPITLQRKREIIKIFVMFCVLRLIARFGNVKLDTDKLHRRMITTPRNEARHKNWKKIGKKATQKTTARIESNERSGAGS